MRTRITFRGLVVALALAALTGAVSGLANLNVQHYARGTPLEALLDLLRPTMLWLREITTDPRFLVMTALLVGGALFLWADTILRRWTAWRDAHKGIVFRQIDRRLLAMTAVLIFGAGLVVSIMWLAIESRLHTDNGDTSKTTPGGPLATPLPRVVTTPPPPPPDPVLKYLTAELSKTRDDLVSIKREDLSCNALSQWQARADKATRLAWSNNIQIHNAIGQHVGSCQNITDPDVLDGIRTNIVKLLDQGIYVSRMRGG